MGRKSQHKMTGVNFEERVDEAGKRRKRLAELKAKEDAALTKALLEPTSLVSVKCDEADRRNAFF